jgi:hypothetical protein
MRFSSDDDRPGRDDAKRGLNYQQQLHMTGIDIDERAIHVAYTQLPLLHIPTALYVGNTLIMEMREVWYTPAHIMGGWNFKPMREHAQGRGQVEDVRSSVKADIKLESPRQEMLFDLDDRGLGR